MTHCTGAFGTYYRWLIFLGILIFGGFVAFHKGLVGQLIQADDSYLSGIIILLFLLASLDAGRRARQLGKELCTAMKISASAQRGESLFVRESKRGIGLAPAHDTHSHAHQHLRLLANKTWQHGALCGQDLLLERLENALGRGHETGWFLADLMIRLGLLGTVIGFIFMLGSVANVESVDIHALQKLLTNMSGGMRIALYTTLTGLGCGILLGFQYRLLDQAVDRLMAEIIELSEVHVTSQLRQLTVS